MAEFVKKEIQASDEIVPIAAPPSRRVERKSKWSRYWQNVKRLFRKKKRKQRKRTHDHPLPYVESDPRVDENIAYWDTQLVLLKQDWHRNARIKKLCCCCGTMLLRGQNIGIEKQADYRVIKESFARNIMFWEAVREKYAEYYIRVFEGIDVPIKDRPYGPYEAFWKERDVCHDPWGEFRRYRSNEPDVYDHFAIQQHREVDKRRELIFHCRANIAIIRKDGKEGNYDLNGPTFARGSPMNIHIYNCPEDGELYINRFSDSYCSRRMLLSQSFVFFRAGLAIQIVISISDSIGEEAVRANETTVVNFFIDTGLLCSDLVVYGEMVMEEQLRELCERKLEGQETYRVVLNYSDCLGTPSLLGLCIQQHPKTAITIDVTGKMSLRLVLATLKSYMEQAEYQANFTQLEFNIFFLRSMGPVEEIKQFVADIFNEEYAFFSVGIYYLQTSWEKNRTLGSGSIFMESRISPGMMNVKLHAYNYN